ncbi:hypothetical protein Glove_319g67 [Diversispora epigaea]|uniref:AGC-kinase C-terminal domain-containing protein n=1 Tax=Diversispora epigaea TaxID=1348612 RepID=A0A397HV29_9GLOM|nr:hypothetical protein Glove_319g67 [Diversispora epigaea]
MLETPLVAGLGRAGTFCKCQREVRKQNGHKFIQQIFYQWVNWEDMFYKKVPPPFYPLISSPTDTSNFDDEFTKELPVLTPVNSQLTADNQDEFRGFSYVSDLVVNGEKQ